MPCFRPKLVLSPARPADCVPSKEAGHQPTLPVVWSPTSTQNQDADPAPTRPASALSESGQRARFAPGSHVNNCPTSDWLPDWPDDLRSAMDRLAPRGVPIRPMPGGRSNLVLRVGSLVVKFHRPETASPLFPNDPRSETRALRLLGPLGLAPRLRAIGKGWLCYDHLEGASWRYDTAAAAVALRRLHMLAPPHGQFRSLPTGTRMLRRDAARVAQGLAGLPALPETIDVPAVTRPVLVHGDAVPGNLIENVGEVRSIDWQCPGLGDPVDDLAAFLSPAMQALYRGRPLDAAERDAFLSAYEADETVARYRALAPLLHWRIAAHCLWRARRGDPGYAQAFALECTLI